MHALQYADGRELSFRGLEQFSLRPSCCPCSRGKFKGVSSHPRDPTLNVRVPYFVLTVLCAGRSWVFSCVCWVRGLMRTVALSPLKVWGPFQKQLEAVTPSSFLGLLALRCSDCPECTLQHQHSPRETRAGVSVDTLGSISEEPQVGTYICSEPKSASAQQPLLPCPVLTQHKSTERSF